jgi:hypothetical protein
MRWARYVEKGKAEAEAEAEADVGNQRVVGLR